MAELSIPGCWVVVAGGLQHHWGFALRNPLNQLTAVFSEAWLGSLHGHVPVGDGGQGEFLRWYSLGFLLVSVVQEPSELPVLTSHCLCRAGLEGVPLQLPCVPGVARPSEAAHRFRPWDSGHKDLLGWEGQSYGTRAQ